MNCRVSVIVPVYNCKNYLSRAVDSVLSQKDFSLDELILIDDGSTDGSGEICDSYKNHHSNIKVIHQKNSGVSAARNAGIKASKGEWIFFLDSDDYLFGENVFEKLLQFSEADLINGKHKCNTKTDDNFDVCFIDGIYKKQDIFEQLNEILVSRQVFYPCWSRLYKRSIIEKYDVKFPVNVKFAEDMVFVYTYLKYCNTIAFSKDEIYFYYVNTDNATFVVPKSFDVYLYIYNWQMHYFKELDVLTETVFKQLNSVFVYKSFVSLKIAADSLKFFESVKYINEILNNNLFFDLYLKERMTFDYSLDKLIDKYIKSKNAMFVMLSVRFFSFKSKVFRLLKGDNNG